VTVTKRWTVAGRAVLSASALVILTAVPELLVTTAPSTRAYLIAGVVALLIVWLWFWWSAIDSPNPLTPTIAVGLMIVSLASLSYVAPPGRDGLLLAALAAGATFRTRQAAFWVVGVALLAGGIQLAHGSSPLVAVGAAVNDFVVGAVSIGGRLLFTTNRLLVRAQDEMAQLAVAEERLRVARDLHDVLGQNLTLAVLRSELVARDLPPDTPTSLRQTQAEVAASLRQALDDVRSVVAGYRSTDLRTELAAARSALAAANIELKVSDELGAVPAVQDAVLAWALRESVTNVVRHSRSKSCVIRLRRETVSAVLEVADDGLGAIAHKNGSGLTGIAERTAAVGGSLSANRTDDRGFQVRVSVPVPQA
jgi:two-component system sensor histidine kinase DesK